MEKKSTKRVGRPTKYKEEFNSQVTKLAILGATDKEIADFFEIDEATLNRWKKSHVEFCESIKKGKMLADMNVGATLYQKAIGYKAKTQKAFKLRNQTNGVGFKEKVEVVTVEEQHPPDTTAIIFWLKNRQPEKWTDKKEVNHKNNGGSFDSLEDKKRRVDELKQKLLESDD